MQFYAVHFPDLPVAKRPQVNHIERQTATHYHRQAYCKSRFLQKIQKASAMKHYRKNKKRQKYLAYLKHKQFLLAKAIKYTQKTLAYSKKYTI